MKGRKGIYCALAAEFERGLGFDTARTPSESATKILDPYVSDFPIKIQGALSYTAVFQESAIVAMKYNPIIRDLCQRLSERDLAKMAIVGASMRKLLVLAYGVIKSNIAFDPSFAQKGAPGS